MIFINKFKRLLAFVFSFLFFIPSFSPNVHGVKYINILIVGKPGAGKSTLMYHFDTQNFDRPIDETAVREYKHCTVYQFLSYDGLLNVVEANFDDENIDYFYQNANIIIHMSNIGKGYPLPTKEEVSGWYDKFVRCILRGQQQQSPEWFESAFNALNIETFEAHPENVIYCNGWFSPLQLKGKIGYIIFVFSGLDNNPDFDDYTECQELWSFIGDFPNSRSILTFDTVSAKGEHRDIHTGAMQKGLVTMNQWVHSESILSTFGAFDDSKKKMFQKSKRDCSTSKHGGMSFGKGRQKPLRTSNPTKCACLAFIGSGILLFFSFIADCLCCSSGCDEENLLIKKDSFYE